MAYRPSVYNSWPTTRAWWWFVNLLRTWFGTEKRLVEQWNATYNDQPARVTHLPSGREGTASGRARLDKQGRAIINVTSKGLFPMLIRDLKVTLFPVPPLVPMRNPAAAVLVAPTEPAPTAAETAAAEPPQ